MANSNLDFYLNDHLAGSVVALEMMEHLENAHAGSKVASFLADLRAEILADRADLERLMQRLSIAPSPVRKTMAWLSEKSAEFKLSLDDRSTGPLHLLEAVEAIAIGIHGKAGLWSALAAARVQGLPASDLERLERRATDQRNRIEQLRLDAAKLAFHEQT